MKAYRKYIPQNKNTIIYGYENGQVIPAKIISKLYKLPLVTRFQGTALVKNKKHNIINRIRAFPAYEALKIKADLTIMTNDGSKGDRILKEVQKNANKNLFMINGLDLMKWDIEDLYNKFNKNEFKLKIGLKENDLYF
ncbi:MAG: hypothetical protein R3Y12_05515 [Clostridia bacterium]